MCIFIIIYSHHNNNIVLCNLKLFWKSHVEYKILLVFLKLLLLKIPNKLSILIIYCVILMCYKLFEYVKP